MQTVFAATADTYGLFVAENVDGNLCLTIMNGEDGPQLTIALDRAQTKDFAEVCGGYYGDAGDDCPSPPPCACDVCARTENTSNRVMLLIESAIFNGHAVPGDEVIETLSRLSRDAGTAAAIQAIDLDTAGAWSTNHREVPF